MRALIITVAGTATRFNRDTHKPTLKCLYHQKSLKDTILYKLLQDAVEFDRAVIVGGYLFDELKDALSSSDFSCFQDRVSLIFNPEYSTRGSMESLFLGIVEAEALGASEIIFAEGDLVLDRETYRSVLESKSNVLTVNSESIDARKSVALYFNEQNHVRYLYDTSHKSLVIPEPFLQIHNSAQVWKFVNTKLCYNLNRALTLDERGGTNLILIQKYFQQVDPSEIHVYKFKEWFNCNTVSDYFESMKIMGVVQ